MSSITLTIPSNQDARVLAAIGQRLGLVDGNGVQRSATGPEVKQWLLDDLKTCVLEVELYQARVAASAGVSPISPT